MHNSNLSAERTAQIEKETFQHLKNINDLIKNPLGRESGFEQLNQIDSEELSPGLKMYFFYIKGKHYSLLYRNSEEKEIEILERANDCFDDIVYTAREHSVRVKSPKYLFVRAFTKFQLSERHSTQSLKEKFRNHSQHLTQQALNIYSDNNSLIWLKAEIEK
ncbi:hypothetical protein [Aequorivita vladivostokensis]|uniref:Uncharacterized protein n=1 Tax=Aequorivita vladivostokensis TaxID=171194 RepID=A0ABR5DM76_9FLAO|nr:hypothetical protein [Aequorivita vladivostokensis]KJJ39884.1 hypothetical protein MB09_01560 [Aequorivita vladivostokensis]